MSCLCEAKGSMSLQIQAALPRALNTTHAGLLLRPSRGRTHSSHSPRSHSGVSKEADVWLQHPAVFTLQQLGLWQTSFLGIVPPRAGAGPSNGTVRDFNSKNSSAAQQKRAATPADAVILQHWFRCRVNNAGSLDLRGVGSVYPSVVRLLRGTTALLMCPGYVSMHAL